MPLMNRTVRLERGAWSLLNRAAVRARATASSWLSTVAPKLPIEVAGAPGVSKTARIAPVRSVTATTTGILTESTAFCTTVSTSVAESGAAGDVFWVEAGDELLLQAERMRPETSRAMTLIQTASRRRRAICMFDLEGTGSDNQLRFLNQENLIAVANVIRPGARNEGAATFV